MTSSTVQNCFSTAPGATIRIVKGEWDTSAPSSDPQPRLSVSIPSSQLQFQPYGYPPQVQLLSTSTSQYPSTEDLSGRRESSSSKRSRNGADGGNGDGVQKTTSPRTSSDRGKKRNSRPTTTPAPAPAPAASAPESQQSRPSNPKENNNSVKGTTGKGKETATKTNAIGSETPRKRRKPTKKLTTHQKFYIFVIDGLGAVILSGAINFAIAYAMYTSHPPESPAPPILLFHLPNSLAGDAAVTIILQTVITWLVELFLVGRDLERGGIAPVGFVGIPGRGKLAGPGDGKGKEPGAGYETDMDLEKGNLKGSTGDGSKGEGQEIVGRRLWSWSWNWRTFIRWFCFLNDADDQIDCKSSPTNHPESESKPGDGKGTGKGTGITDSLSLIWSQILRGLLISVLMFFLLWGPCVGVLMALGRKDATIGAKGDWVFDQRVWLPQAFKFILGGLLALLETPAFAFFWMVKAGWDFQAQTQDQGGLGDRMTVKATNGNSNGVVGVRGVGVRAVVGRDEDKHDG